MLLTHYGHGEIKCGGVTYTVVPSFYAISRIGTPSEIVDCIEALTCENIISKYGAALKVLNACSDKKIPKEIFGELNFDDYHIDKSGAIQGLNLDYDLLNDLFVWATHCIKHGVCGGQASNSDSSDSKPLAEFDAYEYINLATAHFKMSYEEAAKMTMTQFVDRMRVEYPEAHKKAEEEKRLEIEQQELLRYAQDMGI